MDYIRRIHVLSMHTKIKYWEPKPDLSKTKTNMCMNMNELYIFFLVGEWISQWNKPFFKAQTSDRRYNMHRTCFTSIYKWYHASTKSTTQLNYALGRIAFDGCAMNELCYPHFDNKNWLLCAFVKFHLNISFWPMCWAAYGSSSQT